MEIPALGPPSHVGTVHGHCSDPDNSGGDSWELRIVLVGKTGAGKSATGNTLLGRREFESRVSGGSVTMVCRKARTTWKGRDIAVIDIPGIFDTVAEENENLNRIAHFMTLSSPGPHAVFLVLQVGRFTQEEKAAVEQLHHILGPELVKFLIILFTRKDDLEEASVGDYVRSIGDPYFQELLEKCEHRCCAFNNRASGAQRDAQVSELMAMIGAMVQANGGTHYTNNIYKSVEELLQKKTEAYCQHYKELFERQREEMRQKYEKMFDELMKEKEKWKEDREQYEKEREEDRQWHQKEREEWEKQKKNYEKEYKELWQKYMENCKHARSEAEGCETIFSQL